MGYPKQMLHDDETIVVELNPHWWHFAKPVAALAGSIVLGIVVLVVTDGGSTARTALGWITIALLVGTAGWAIQSYITWISTMFVITNNRVIYRSGVFRKTGLEIPLQRVNAVHFSQSLFERMIGAGDLMIESAAEEGQQRFTDIRNPDRIQHVIQGQMEEKEKSRFAGLSGGGGGGADVASQLEKLEGMLQRGTLTKDEFDAQKARLLGG